jgi:hypothetical protein
MDTLTDTIFSGGGPEYTSIHSDVPVIDFTDSPCSPAECAADTASALFYTTAQLVNGLQFGYLRCQPPGPCTSTNSWVRAINDASVGLPNYFTWLNAWNPAAPQPGTIRQGFSQTPRSVNPYVASTTQDEYVVGSIYDSLHLPNPLASQSIDSMTINTVQISNSSLTYVPPAHTLTTFRFTLRGDLFFQDGRQATSYDVAFSYLSMVGSGSFLGTLATPMTGITILGSRQFDISVNSLAPLVLPNLTSLPIVPGRYWTNAGSSAWDSAISGCNSVASCPISQYTLSGSTVNCVLGCSPSPSLMTVNPSDVTPTFDPIANHVFVGSGPWECGTITSAGSGTCTSSGTESPPAGGSFTLTRFGRGLAPASSVTSIYFRSSGNLALCIWATSNCTSSAQQGFLLISQIFACYGQPVNPTGPCSHWQRGLGNILGNTGQIIGLQQVSIVIRFASLNWIAPYNWFGSPPTGIAPFPPVLYEGSVTLNPCSIDPVNGYDC